MNLKRFIEKCLKGIDIITLKGQPSYAQTGEDLLARYYFDTVGIQKPTYLEIGTNQPISCNNTYFFYRNHSHGVCIEPDTSMIEIIKKARPRDVVLNIGVGVIESAGIPFFAFPGWRNSWNTFSEEEAAIREQESGIKPEVKQVPIRNINSVIAEHFKKAPDFLSIDVEGMDLAILQSLNFDLYSPGLICTETITFSTDNTEKKTNDIHLFMESKGYYVFADTHINTLFSKRKF